MSFIEPLQSQLNVRIGPLLRHRLQARVETWRLTGNSRFAGGVRSAPGSSKLNCGHPDLTGLDPGNMPR
jgi:hypothetical protein